MQHSGTPFIIYALPRSGTFWLSRFLTFGGYACAHEQARHVRAPADVRSWLAQDHTGTSETAAAPFWRLVQHYRPDVRTLVVRRPVAEVVDSLMRLDMQGVCTFDRDLLTKIMKRQDRRLDQIERCVPGVLSVQFADLFAEDTCASIFEHCLALPHNHDWWAAMAPLNLQCSMPALMRHALTHQPQMKAAGVACWHKMQRLMRTDRLPQLAAADDGVTIQEETFECFWNDGKALFAEHCEAVGEEKTAFFGKNLPFARLLDEAGAAMIVTARCNGRMLGYLASIIGPSLEEPNLTVGTQTTFFATKDAGGMNLGLRLQRASIEAMRRRGVGQAIMYAGVRGSGRRIGVLYRRMGAKEFGQLYRLDLKAA